MVTFVCHFNIIYTFTRQRQIIGLLATIKENMMFTGMDQKHPDLQFGLSSETETRKYLQIRITGTVRTV